MGSYRWNHIGGIKDAVIPMTTIIYINVLGCPSVTMLAKLKYIFRCPLLFLQAAELHKKVQEGVPSI